LGRPPARSDAPVPCAFHSSVTGQGTAVLWAQIKSSCERKGKTITFADAWIAASAVQLDAPLVTNNAGDYDAVENLTILTASARS
jgi:predicted nucleic acid-binding protein